MIFHAHNLVADDEPREYVAVSIWTAVMALAVPVFALVVTPVRFAAALLFGGLAADVVFFVYHYFFWNDHHARQTELTPGGMHRELSANKAQALLARIRPAGEVSQIRVLIARDHLADIRALDARMKYIGTQIADLEPHPAPA